MALVSFKIRKDDNNGSALRRTNLVQDSTTPAGSGTALFDSALRSDGYFEPVPQQYLNSTFSANIYKRGEIELKWRLDVELTDTVTTSAFEPVELLIRGSGDGEPITPADGFEVVRIIAGDGPYYEEYIDIAGLSRPYIAEGSWAYYSLFIKFKNNTNDSYYENLADISVQTPINFGSTEELWNHVPEYYRQLDDNYMLSTEDYAFTTGPLYRFVELFGWELDRMRTTIYDTMRVNDPEVVHSSAIDALAKQAGIEFNRDALGTAKLRSILNNIGYLRRTKGTTNSIKAYISAMSGCSVSANTAVSPIQFNIHPMRVNLFSDPFFSQSATTTDTTGIVRRNFSALNEGGREYGWGVASVQPSSGLAADNIINITDGVLTVTLAAGTGNSVIYIYSRGAFTYNNNLTYYGSALSSDVFNTRFMAKTAMLTFEGLANSSTTSPVLFDNWVTGGLSGTPESYLDATGGNRKISASKPDDVVVAPTDVVGVFVLSVEHPATGTKTVTFTKPMIEYKNSSGVFFSGSEPMGGFIPRAGVSGDGLYDYHWGQNAISSINTDFSYYTLDYHRARKVTEDIVKNYVIPVTLVDTVDYVINWEVLE